MEFENCGMSFRYSSDLAGNIVSRGIDQSHASENISWIIIFNADKNNTG